MHPLLRRLVLTVTDVLLSSQILVKAIWRAFVVRVVILHCRNVVSNKRVHFRCDNKALYKYFIDKPCLSSTSTAGWYLLLNSPADGDLFWRTVADWKLLLILKCTADSKMSTVHWDLFVLRRYTAVWNLSVRPAADGHLQRSEIYSWLSITANETYTNQGRSIAI